MIGISIDLVTPHKFLATASGEEVAVTKYTRSYTDFSFAGTGNAIVLASLPAKRALVGAIIRPTVSFAGPGITNVVIGLGYNSTTTNFASPYSVSQAIFDNTAQESMGAFYLGDFVASWPVYARATSTGGNLNTLTAGSVDIYLFTIDLP